VLDAQISRNALAFELGSAFSVAVEPEDQLVIRPLLAGSIGPRKVLEILRLDELELEIGSFDMLAPLRDAIPCDEITFDLWPKPRAGWLDGWSNADELAREMLFVSRGRKILELSRHNILREESDRAYYNNSLHESEGGAGIAQLPNRTLRRPLR
jgi:hypothetical protein